MKYDWQETRCWSFTGIWFKVLVYDSKGKHRKVGRQDIQSHHDWVLEDHERIQIVDFNTQKVVISRDVLFEEMKQSTKICERDDKNDHEFKHKSSSINDVGGENVDDYESANDTSEMDDFPGISNEDAAESSEASLESSIGVRRSGRIRNAPDHGGQTQLSSRHTLSRQHFVKQSLVMMLHNGILQCLQSTSRS
jgi:hypothetical protein